MTRGEYIFFLVFISLLLFPFSIIITPLIISLKSQKNNFKTIETTKQTSDIKCFNRTTNESELDVFCSLKQLNKKPYAIINNVMISSKDGNTTDTQIDHIVISKSGIYCIETKSDCGWIFGSDRQNYWTSVFYQHRHKLYNPIKQNYAHTRAISNLLGSHLKYPVISIVIFPNADKLNLTNCNRVFNIEEALDFIDNRNASIYSIEECERITNSINFSNKKDQQTYIKHCAEVNNLVELTNMCK